MIVPSKSQWRENPSRAIYLTGRIDQELVNKLTPLINVLRLSSTEPITVYIDSRGGSTASANTIRNLIRATNPDGESCELVAVVTGTAASAAADFMAFADYSYAFDHADILFHGVRQEPNSTLTVEGANQLASQLQNSNEFFAMSLARHAFRRFVFRISQLQSEFQHYRNATPSRPDALSELLAAIKRKLSQGVRGAVTVAHEKHILIEELNTYVVNSLRKIKKFSAGQYNQSQTEVAIFQAILKYKSNKHSSDVNEWKLSDAGLSEVNQDFLLLTDYFWGRPKRHMRELIDTYASLLLSDELNSQYAALNVSEEDKRIWLYSNAESAILPLWYFTVSLCRVLQTADYRFDPEDAYWLGFVDEVPGSGLPTLREMVEAMPDSATGGDKGLTPSTSGST